MYIYIYIYISFFRNAARFSDCVTIYILNYFDIYTENDTESHKSNKNINS